MKKLKRLWRWIKCGKHYWYAIEQDENGAYDWPIGTFNIYEELNLGEFVIICSRCNEIRNI
ncbi:unnamed protein product [marine sediment metagenome]|uniref:Uncharacterized protein n=1 Tax=marine sediment metagenome TaxID=412755 RepID=X1D994_9ZZZZ